MKKVTIIFSIILISISTYAQISVLSINGIENGCDGIVSLQSEIEDLEFFLQGPNGGVEYQFDGTLLTISELCEGEYETIYFDELGCDVKSSFTISSCNQINISANITTTCNGAETGSIEIQDPNDGNFYDYIWNNGYQGTVNEGLVGGQYTVTATDQNNCKSVKSYVVKNSSPVIVLKELSGLDGDGKLVVDVEGVAPTNILQPYTIEWSDPSNIIISISSDGHTVEFNNANQLATSLYITVTDIYGCIAEKEIEIKNCNVDEFDFYLDFFNSTCDGADNLQLTILGSAKFVEYKIEISAPTPSGWITFVEGSSPVSEGEQGEFIKVTLEGSFFSVRISLTDECGKTITHKKRIDCDCVGSQIPLIPLDIPFCEIADNSRVFLIRHPDDFDYVCNLSTYFSNTGICLDIPWSYLVKFHDKSVFEVSFDGSGNAEWKTIVSSSKVDPENGDFEFELDEERIYEHIITTGPNCNTHYYLNLDFKPAYSIAGAGFLDVFGPNGIVTAQGINFSCKSCKSLNFLNFPYSLYLNNLNQFCTSESVSWDYFNWGVFDLEFPFSGGGVFNVLGEGQVVIPPNSPFIEIQYFNDQFPNCRAALFAEGYAQGPVYQGYPIFVTYCPDVLNEDGDEDGCLIDCDCEYEWTEQIAGCNLEVTCKDDLSNPVVLGLIPNLNSITPCRSIIGSECEVVGFCTETNDYYTFENGDYYYYPNLDCSNLDIPYCSDLENGLTDLYNANCGSPCVVYQNSPNPFVKTASTTIAFCSSTSGMPELLIYDAEENLVYAHTNEYTNAGNSTFDVPGGTLAIGGVYTYQYSINGCTSNELTMVVTNSLSGEDEDTEIRQVENKNIKLSDLKNIEFEVYPNPNTGDFYIENEFNVEITNVNLFDISGREISISLINNNERIEIKLHDKKAGLYIIRITTLTNEFYQKVIIQ